MYDAQHSDPSIASISKVRSEGSLFPQTMWSMISGAAHQDEIEVRASLGRIAQAYWQPLYVFVRQRGMTHEDAADAVQGFFVHLMGTELLRGLAPRETRFRSFLLRCFQNWLISEYRRETTQRRGGTDLPIPLSDLAGEIREDAPTPEVAFDRRWARTIFSLARAKLKEAIDSRERAEFFRELEARIFQSGTEGPHWSEVAERFDMNETAVRKAAMDLRARFAGLLRREVRSCVSEESEVDDELRYLLKLLSAG